MRYFTLSGLETGFAGTLAMLGIAVIQAMDLRSTEIGTGETPVAVRAGLGREIRLDSKNVVNDLAIVYFTSWH
jgi:hypothetical protein